MSLAEALAKATPMQRTVAVCMDGQAFAELEALIDERDALPPSRKLKDDARRDIEARFDAARERAEAAEVSFTVRSIGAFEWTDLVVAHQAKDGDPALDLGIFSKSVPAGVLVVGRGFVAAVLSACLLEPTATLEEAQQLVDTLSHGQLDRLWQAVMEMNAGSGEIPKSEKRSAGTASSDASATTAAPEESRTASSPAA